MKCMEFTPLPHQIRLIGGRECKWLFYQMDALLLEEFCRTSQMQQLQLLRKMSSSVHQQLMGEQLT